MERLDRPEISPGEIPVEEEISAGFERLFSLLDKVRRAVLDQCDPAAKYLVRSAGLNVYGDRRAEAEAVLERALGSFTWDEICEVLRWGWEQVATGSRAPSLHACTFTGGGFSALAEQHGRALAAQSRRREAQRPQEQPAAERSPEERLAGLRAVFEEASSTSPFAAGLLAAMEKGS